MTCGRSTIPDRFKPLWIGRVAVGVALLLASRLGTAAAQQVSSMPKLVHQHGASQILVDGKPFLIRGGELENSSASSLSYMKTVWPKVDAMHFNTVLAPVYWQLIEPREGEFDFSTLDGLIEGARQHKVRLVLLWFGSWKNSMSSYAPDWVKQDQERFPRATKQDGSGLEILSAFSPNNLAGRFEGIRRADESPAEDRFRKSHRDHGPG